MLDSLSKLREGDEFISISSKKGDGILSFLDFFMRVNGGVHYYISYKESTGKFIFSFVFQHKSSDFVIDSLKMLVKGIVFREPAEIYIKTMFSDQEKVSEG